MRITTIIALLLSSFGVWAQTNKPLPSGATPFGSTTFISPLDSTIWLYKERGGVAINLGSWHKTDSLIKTRQKATSLDITDFGAVGDSSTINTQAFNDAFDFAVTNGFRHIYVPTGTYLVDGIISIPKDISMFGDGYSSCIIPVGDAADYQSDVSPSRAVVFNTGTQSTIGALSTSLAKNSMYIKQSSLASALKENEVFKLLDTASFSFSGYRAGDKNGEYFTVIRINVDTVFLDHPVSDTYSSPTSTIAYKMNLSTSKLTGLRVTANSVSPNIPRVIFEKVGNTILSDLYLFGALTGNIRVSDGYNITLDRITSYQTLPTPSGGPQTQYGLVIGGVQNFIVSNSNLFGVRHAFTSTSGGNDVLTRFGTVYNTRMFSTKSYAADLHGAASDVTFDNNIMTGVQLRGRSHKLLNNTIIPCEEYHAIKIIEVKRLDFAITGNDIKTNEVFIQIEPASTYSGNPSVTYQPDQGGILKISGNTMESLNTDSATFYNSPFRWYYSRAMTRDLKNTVVISDNTIICRNRASQDLYVLGYGVSAKLGSAIVSGNKLTGARIRAGQVKSADISNNFYDSMPTSAVYASEVDSIYIAGNKANKICTETDLSNASACFALALNCGFAYIANNAALTNGNATQSFRVQGVSMAIIGDNYFGTLTPFFSSVTFTRYPSSQQLNITGMNSAPSSSSATGLVGEIRVVDGYVYVCVANNTWKRVALTTW